MKKSKIIKIVIIIIIVLTILAAAFSIYKFQVINPISSGFGMIEILWTNKPYTVVQNLPNRVMFINVKDKNLTPQEILNSYMKDRGFTELKDHRMGSLLVYTNGANIEKIDFQVNGYYSKCVWQ